jgi:hypothetical protein
LSSEQGEIRLLDILSACDEAVVCDLIHVSLDDDLIFSALSYVWGDPKDVEPITICNQVVYVTRTLRSALRYVKKHWGKEFAERERSTLWLWADAICINQKDPKERGQQVPLMARIYSTAEAVFAFIRHSETDVLPLAIDTFEKIDHILVTGRDGELGVSTLQGLLSEDAPPQLGTLAGLRNERWYAIREFDMLPGLEPG